jgi:hypothetical protein
MEAHAQCWTNVLVKVTKDTNASLTRDLVLKEIHNAIKALPKGKAPGHDGVPMEFFHECVKEVAPTLLKAFTVVTPLWPSVGLKPNTWKSWGFGVLQDSRMFRAQQKGAKHLSLGCSWCPWKDLET